MNVVWWIAIWIDCRNEMNWINWMSSVSFRFNHSTTANQIQIERFIQTGLNKFNPFAVSLIAD